MRGMTDAAVRKPPTSTELVKNKVNDIHNMLSTTRRCDTAADHEKRQADGQQARPRRHGQAAEVDACVETSFASTSAWCTRHEILAF